jgi:hypothetical protein
MSYTDRIILFINQVERYTPTECNCVIKYIDKCIPIHKDDSNYVEELNAQRNILLAISSNEYQRQLKIGF